MTNTIPNVPRELLERVLDYDGAVAIRQNARHELRALLSAPSPAGVDGWDVAGDILEKLSDAQAIIDGLRGEVAALRKRAKTAEREAGSALATYKGLEKVARVVSDNSDQVCGELNVLRQQFDQQAQRIGELEGLLRDFAYHTQRREMPTESSLAAWADRLDAALSAGKEGDQ